MALGSVKALLFLQGPEPGTYMENVILNARWIHVTPFYFQRGTDMILYSSQFDLPFVEVHRVKAFRFSLPPEDSCEDMENEAERERANQESPECGMESDTKSRTGSQQQLTDRARGAYNARGDWSRQKALFCGPCCSEAPSVSVWNCDGEILTFSEIQGR